MDQQRSFKATQCKRCQDSEAGKPKMSQTPIEENKKMTRRSGGKKIAV